MRWRKVEGSGHVEDRRGRRGAKVGGAVGGLGILGILAALFFSGGSGGLDLNDLFNQVGGGAQAAPSGQDLDTGPDPQADLVEFMKFVMTDNQNVWDQIFRDAGSTYEFTTLVIFEDFTQSACGGASAQVGPHYCSLDRTVYLDLDFFTTLQERMGAGGDFAQAYVISHELGHHVQNLVGTLGQVQQLSQQRPDLRNDASVRQELQADCFAGVWGSTVFATGAVSDADLNEAFEAARAVGDDRIQQQATGSVNPEAWTHGSSADRLAWYKRGLETGNPDQCDTFSS